MKNYIKTCKKCVKNVISTSIKALKEYLKFLKFMKINRLYTRNSVTSNDIDFTNTLAEEQNWEKLLKIRVKK